MDPTSGHVSLETGKRMSVLTQDHYAFDDFPVLKTVVMGNKDLFAIKEEERTYDTKIDDAVKFIFSKMTDSCRQILHLFYFEKMPMDKIAVTLNYKNADTVKSKKNRCISKWSFSVFNYIR